MIQLSTREGFKSIVRSGENIYSLVRTMELTELETKLPEYTIEIEQYFLGLNRDELTINDFESIKQLMFNHNKIVNLIQEEMEKISNGLKQLHTGKEMRKTYPQTAY